LTAQRSLDRWTIGVLSVLVLIPIAFNAVLLWPEVSVPIPSVNDSATHYLLIQRASEALAGGENPLDHWVPELELGFPWFLYYQNLPHLTVILLHRLLLGQVELLTVFNAVRYLLMVGFPLAVYWSMRRMDFSAVAAAMGATVASLFSANGRYGFEYLSYVWLGFGMYTQLWAMSLSFIALACVDRVVEKGRGYTGAIVALSLLVLSHLIYRPSRGSCCSWWACAAPTRGGGSPASPSSVGWWPSSAPSRQCPSYWTRTT
jgi:uncharacterized membrane protein